MASKKKSPKKETKKAKSGKVEQEPPLGLRVEGAPAQSQVNGVYLLAEAPHPAVYNESPLYRKRENRDVWMYFYVDHHDNNSNRWVIRHGKPQKGADENGRERDKLGWSGLAHNAEADLRDPTKAKQWSVANGREWKDTKWIVVTPHFREGDEKKHNEAAWHWWKDRRPTDLWERMRHISRWRLARWRAFIAARKSRRVADNGGSWGAWLRVS